MGVMPATDIFQSRMVFIFLDRGPEKPILYINDIIHLKGETLILHLNILDNMFQRLGKAGMQVNADKSQPSTQISWIYSESNRLSSAKETSQSNHENPASQECQGCPSLFGRHLLHQESHSQKSRYHATNH